MPKAGWLELLPSRTLSAGELDAQPTHAHSHFTDIQGPERATCLHLAHFQRPHAPIKQHHPTGSQVSREAPWEPLGDLRRSTPSRLWPPPATDSLTQRLPSENQSMSPPPSTAALLTCLALRSRQAPVLIAGGFNTLDEPTCAAIRRCLPAPALCSLCNYA